MVVIVCLTIYNVRWNVGVKDHYRSRLALLIQKGCNVIDH